MTLRTRLTEQYGCEFPFVQAGLAFVGATPALASPLLSWAYAVFSPQGFSNLLGVVELATALLVALGPFAPRLGLLGGALAAGTFAITSTFPITGPSWEPSLGGFSPAGGFLIKDLALLDIALAVTGRMPARVGPVAAPA